MKHNKPSVYVVVLITFQALGIGNLSHHLVLINIDETARGAMCVISGSCRSQNRTEAYMLLIFSEGCDPNLATI